MDAHYNATIFLYGALAAPKAKNAEAYIGKT